MRFLPAGDAALLVELADLAHTLALYRALQTQPIAGVHELVPAARTLLVHFHPELLAPPALIAALRRTASALAAHAAEPPPPGRIVEIPVRYDGEDLAELAEHLGVSARELVARHTGQPWQAAFAGFAPGFVYLAGGDALFTQIPRRKTPRTRVPAGSVALAGDFSAIYPSASPGGWQLIGTTACALWDRARAEPALVQPGFQVRFVETGRMVVAGGNPSPQPSPQRGERVPGSSASRVSPPLPLGEGRGEGQQRLDGHAAVDAPAAPIPTFPQRGKVLDAEICKQNQPPALTQKALSAIEIINPGLQTLIQDEGRHGLAGLGISASGTLDRPAMHQANRLVGNPPDAPVLENLLGGLQLRALGRATLAVAGADAPLHLTAPDGRAWPVPNHAAIALDAGDVLRIGAPVAGVRCYLAVRGGWQVDAVLGSCATDTLAHVGPAALHAGQRLFAGHAIAAHALAACAPSEAPHPALPRAGDEVLLDVLLGPRTDWFTPEAIALLPTQPWQVTPQSNRVGMRLQGAAPLTRARHDELPSEGTVIGAIQVPASGQPVLFLADHPLTGGYPVIAVLARHHRSLAAQIPVGCLLRFRVIASFKEG